MKIPPTTYKKLLRDTSRVIRHQKELSILKGENFNVFSLLKMESRENDTHSMFLAELLNPKGSHNLGSIFLKSFLKHLEIDDHLDIETTKVFIEKYVGTRNDKIGIGGRVDIFLEDTKGNSICIENKIYAADQNAQIARYCNYNSGKNKVYYLTLEGQEPSQKSYKKKILNEDFFTISYKGDMLEWLEQCQKEAVQYPILRETINQYIILIKKLTNQLSDHKMEQEIKDIIIANYKASKVIESNIATVELEHTKLFLSEIVEKLKEKLSKDFNILMSDDLNKPWSGIKITNSQWPEEIIVKLEGESKITWNKSIYGVHCHKDKFDREQLKSSMKNIDFVKSGFGETAHWPYYKNILNFNQTEERAKLFKTNEREFLVEETTEKLLYFLKLCEKPFASLKSIDN